MTTHTHPHLAVLDELTDLVAQTDPMDRPLHQQTILLFGHPGTAKTSIAAGAPNHLYIDLEASASAHAVRGMRITSWAAFEKLVDYAYAGGDLAVLTKNTASPGPVEVIVIDTATDLWRLCREHVLAGRGIETEPENDYGKTLNYIRDLFMRYINKLLVLNTRDNLGLILIAHEETEEVKEPTRTYNMSWPMMPDRKIIRPFIAGKPQIVMRTIKTTVNPVTGAALGKIAYVVQAQPIDERQIIKDRTGRLPGFIESSWASLEAAYNEALQEKA